MKPDQGLSHVMTNALEGLHEVIGQKHPQFVFEFKIMDNPF